jgi:hypothetical protein
MKKSFAGMTVLGSILILTSPLNMLGAEDAASGAADNSAVSAVSSSNQPTEIDRLKKQLADQQRQIEELRSAITGQKTPAEDATPKYKSLGEVASTTPMLPPAPAATTQDLGTVEAAPLQFRLGSAYITPLGFMDFTTVTRSTNPGSGIGTSFGSIPFSTPSNVQGNQSETRFSPQNSRIGLRADAMVHGTHVIGYLESDFLGSLSGTTNVAVSSDSFPLRMRLYWVDLRKGKFEVLAGQSWSLLTPGRNGISPLPADVFYTQDMDVNYQAGLVWSRDPGFRFVYHAAPAVALAVALESPEQYIGGSSGGSTVACPSGLVTSYCSNTQLNGGSSTLSTPGAFPDVIAKIAFDPKVGGRSVHFEVAGLNSVFKVYNPTSVEQFTKTGQAGSVNLSFELFKGFRLLTNNFYGAGGGRYIFGQAPDVIVRGDGSLSTVHSGSTVTGFEAQVKNTLIYGYYGGIYIGRNVAVDPAKGNLVGYGYAGGSQNRAIQEATFGINQTFWKDARYGALNFIAQYSYLQRNPWYVAAGTPSNANLSMGFLDLRYTLPGTAPILK